MHALPPHRRVPLTAFALSLLLAAGGCRGPAAPPPDAATARQAFLAALDAWAAGKSTADLRDQEPPLYVSDPDWEAGRALQAYELSDQESFDGQALRTAAKLSFAGDRRAKSVAAKYTVGTTPVLTVVRVMD
jgi:hypothetical protein